MSWEKDAERIKYENDLINHRLTWLGVFEGLLFVAYHYEPHPFWLLPIVGIVVALSIGWGIYEANRKLTELGEQARLQSLMPGFVIPTVIALAWIGIWVWNTWWSLEMNAPRRF